MISKYYNSKYQEGSDCITGSEAVLLDAAMQVSQGFHCPEPYGNCEKCKYLFPACEGKGKSHVTAIALSVAAHARGER